MAEITDDEIRAAALGPKRIETGAGKVEQRSIEELLAARDAVAATSIASAWGAALRPARLIPPGATGPASLGDT